MNKKTKKKHDPIEIPSIIICRVVAIFLILGALGMGMVNLNFKDGFYDNVSVSALLQNGIVSILQTHVSSGSVLTGILVFIAVSLLFCLVLKIVSVEKRTFSRRLKVTIGIVLAALGLRIAAILAWKLPQTSDFLDNYEMAQLLTTIPIGYWGRFLHEMGTQWTGIWSANMPFLLYEAILLKYGISPGVMNVIYGTLTCLFTALAAKELFGEKAFETALLFMALNPLNILFTGIFSNQHPATMLMVAALWIALKYQRLPGALISGAVLSAAQIMRPEMYVVAIGILLIYIIAWVRGEKKGAVRAVAFFAAFAGGILICDGIMRQGGLISGHIYSGNLQYKLCVGLNKETRGGWSQADMDLLNTPSQLWDTLMTRLFERGNLPLMFQKVVYQFGSYVYPWIMDTENHPFFSNLICRRAVSAYMMIIALLAAIKLIRDQKNRNKIFEVGVILFGYMAVYALIEIQPRYNFTIIPLLSMIAADIQMKQESRKKGLK